MGFTGVYWGAGRNCRYSGPEGYRGNWGFLGSVGGCSGLSVASGGVGVYWKAGRDSRYSGARRGIGGIGSS